MGLLVALFVVFFAGSALADDGPIAISRVPVELYHRTKVWTEIGVTVFNPEDSAKKPGFRWLWLRVNTDEPGTLGRSTGEFTFNLETDVTIESDNDKKENLKKGEHKFKLWPDESSDYYYSTPGYDSGADFDFVAGVESALSGQDFSFTLTGEQPVTGTFPTIRTFEKQFKDDKRVPFIEFLFDDDGKTVTDVKWRFVDPADTKTALPNEGDAPTVSNINIDPIGDHSYISYPASSAGSTLEGTIPIDPISIDDLDEVRLFFVYPDGITDNAVVFEQWAFVVNGDDESITGETVTDADIPAVKKAIEENLEPENQPKYIIPVREEDGTGEILTGTQVIKDSNANVAASRTSSIISVKQDLGEGNKGGAVAFTTELGFRANSESVDHVKKLPEPDWSSIAAFKANYGVLKYFEGGGAIDLLDEFGEIFSLDPENKRIKMDATIVIIDRPVPKDEPDVVTSYANEIYGVKLVAGTPNYLYVWDGIEDGIASDPIGLVANEDSETETPGGSSGSGCNAAGFAPLALAAIALATRKKRG
jgi:Synergist-CTERM protein sorting domain-containing protein